jgi:hypothetical protein
MNTRDGTFIKTYYLERVQSLDKTLINKTASISWGNVRIGVLHSAWTGSEPESGFRGGPDEESPAV